jgi:hypothetical protein
MEQKLNLVNLKEGAAIERFDEALALAIANVLDPNTPATKPREITLRVRIIPSEERSMCGIEVTVSTKLQPPSAIGGIIYVGKVAGQYIAAEQNPNQLAFAFPEPSAISDHLRAVAEEGE